MSEPTALIWILIGTILVLLLVLLVVASKLISISRELKKLNGTLSGLEARVAEQEKRLEEVRSSLDQRGGGDMLTPFVEVFNSIRSKGWVAGLTLLGGHLFRSYLGKRRQRALPAKNDP